MRVLLTTDTIGGVWTFTREMTSELLHLGHAVALVSVGRSPSPEQVTWCAAKSGRYGERFRYDASPAPLEWMSDNASAYAGAAPLLLRVASQFEPDVLHSNQFCFGALPVDIPRVVTAHSDVQSWAGACRPEGLAASPWLTKYLQLVMEGLGSADAVAAPTRWMLDALEKHYGPLPGTVIPNGRKLRPEPSEKMARGGAITVGRLWDEAKDVGVLAKVRSPFGISVAGELAFEEKSCVTTSADVQWRAALREDELLRLFRRSCIYVATSIYEPFGLAPLEAALCGCVIVSRNIPSLREVWGDAAVYFEDAASLSTRLEDLWSSPAELRRRKELCGRRAARFSRRRMVEAYLRLYARVGARADAKELAGHVS